MKEFTGSDLQSPVGKSPSEDIMADQTPQPPPQPPSSTPKIIVDSDWKSQAQAEKQRLEEQEARKKAEPPPGLPEKLGFEDLVRLFTSQALSFLGYIPDPQTGQAMVSLEYAKLNIDFLGVLEEKTKGNLTPDEQKMMRETLGELRGAFVETSKAVAQAVKEGRLKPGGMSGGGGAGRGGLPADIATPPAPGLST